MIINNLPYFLLSIAAGGEKYSNQKHVADDTFTFKPTNLSLNVFEDFVFFDIFQTNFDNLYFKHERQCPSANDFYNWF